MYGTGRQTIDWMDETDQNCLLEMARGRLSQWQSDDSVVDSFGEKQDLQDFLQEHKAQLHGPLLIQEILQWYRYRRWNF